MTADLEQALVFVLTADVDEVAADLRQRCCSRQLALDMNAIASASPLQPAGAVKPPTAGKMDPETGKVYSKLSKLYGAMKPEEAVAVFNNLEDEQVVLILSRMEEEAAAKVLASLEPKRAARLTQAMIKRK